MRSRRGFTLIELMIVVGILGVLAAIAIPNYLRFSLRSKSAEPLANLVSLARAEGSYFAEQGDYIGSGVPSPAAVPGSVKVPFPGGPDFDQVGWSPEGAVFFQYAVRATFSGTGLPPSFTAEAAGDLDDDGAQSFYGYVRPATGAASGLDGVLPGTTCAGTGVVLGAQGGVLNTAGPCDADSGRSRF